MKIIWPLTYKSVNRLWTSLNLSFLNSKNRSKTLKLLIKMISDIRLKNDHSYLIIEGVIKIFMNLIYRLISHEKIKIFIVYSWCFFWPQCSYSDDKEKFSIVLNLRSFLYNSKKRFCFIVSLDFLQLLIFSSQWTSQIQNSTKEVSKKSKWT